MTRTLAALILPALALAACGNTEIDAGKTEDVIRKSVVGPEPKSVDCPDGVEARKGETFRCRVVYANGPAATVTVHIEGDDGKIRIGPGDFKLRD